MRIKVVQKPTTPRIDGIQLDQFVPGLEYEVGTTIGALFLAEGWAVPIEDVEPAVLGPLAELDPPAGRRRTGELRGTFPSDELPFDRAADSGERRKGPG